jgi:DNA ligase-1
VGELGDCFLDAKLDGARIQVHKGGDRIAVYSRQGNDVTEAAPEIVEFARGLPARELVLDGEALVLDGRGRPRPFQVTMKRFGRRKDVDAMRAELPLVPFAFDLLHADGEDWLAEPTEARFARLDELVAAKHRVRRQRCTDPEVAEAFLRACLADGHEGLLVKAVFAPYEAGRRGSRWRKVKPVHTLDLVVLAAEWGSGRRAGRLSNLHLGTSDASGGFAMLGKTFKGLTDELLAWQTRELLAREVARDGHVVHVRPELVVEIAFDGVQRSPHYPSGLALRFARVKRYRDDKSVSEIDSLERVRSFLPQGLG